MKMKRVEHVAIAVDSLQRSIELLGSTFGLPLEYEEQISQTRLAMLPVGETYIELLEGQGPESGVTKWIDEKGPGPPPATSSSSWRSSRRATARTPEASPAGAGKKE